MGTVLVGALMAAAMVVGAVIGLTGKAIAAPVSWFSTSTLYDSNTSLRSLPAPVLSKLASGHVADMYAYGFPVYDDVTASTPRYHVNCTENWGTCSLAQQPVPIPANAVASSGSDGTLLIVDPADNLDFELWQAQRTSAGGWSASWGAVMNTSGGSISRDIFGNPGNTGSGLSALAGLATIAQLQAGTIGHALVASSSLTCKSFVAPAVKSDGLLSGPNCLPEGTRLRLNPDVDLAAIPGITPFELAVGRALKTYGVIIRDSGGTPLAINFQEPTSSTDPYAALGAGWDYYNMPHIPWGDLKLAS